MLEFQNETKYNNIFSKFLNFLLKIFKRKDNMLYITEKSDVNIKNEKKEFKADLQKEVEKRNKKEDIINQMERNPDILYQLSEDRLMQLIELYDEKILQLDNENLQLRNQLKRLGEN